MTEGTERTLWYFYDEPLPNRYAASIQILRTGAAFAARPGGRFVHLAGPVGGSHAALLGHYGLGPNAGFEVRGFFPARGAPRVLRGWVLRRALARLGAEIDAGAGRHVAMTRGDTGVALLPALRRLADGRPRLILAHEMHCLSYLRNAERRAGRALGVAELGPDALAERAREGEAVAAADALVFLTPGVEAAARAEFAAHAPGLILPSGTEIGGPDASRVEPRFDVVYAGKIEARKGVRALCEAMRHLPGLRLGVAGGPEAAARDLAAWVTDAGLAERVEVVGLLAPSEVPGFLRSGRVGVCPMAVGLDSVSDWFTSPIKLVQMMGLGMPVVATDVAPVRAVATHGVDALLSAPEDPAAMAAAIAALLADPALAARLGAAARRTAERFSWDARAAALGDFLDRCGPRRRRTG